MEPIEATLHAGITHVSGPTIADPDHVRAWIVADGILFDGGYGGFTYEVCPEHADPEECGRDGTVSLYCVAIFAVSGED